VRYVVRGAEHDITMDQEKAPLFRLLYNGEVRVYECGRALPRAAVFHRVELGRDDTEVLNRLADLALNIFETAVISSNGLESSQRAAIEAIDNLPPAQAEAAEITTYSSQEVSNRTNSGQAGLLVLINSDYPGWKAYVDGREAPWITANYMFRGVCVPAGPHSVVYRYEPASFRRGASISVISLLCLAAVMFLRR